MKQFLLFALIMFPLFFGNAQEPIFVFDETLGGSDIDEMTFTLPISTGGAIIAGGSSSPPSSDKFEDNIGSVDCWIIEIGADGEIVWENTIGGINFDYPSVVRKTSDGGYIIGASSSSNEGFDKSEDSRGNVDFWIIKLNASGVVQWDKTIGGDNFDNLSDLIELSDGNILVIGQSFSGISGDKTEGNKGGADVWIIKIQPEGTLIWQNTIGGTGFDIPRGIVELKDGSFVAVVESNSDTSEDKSEPSLGLSDYWLLGIDSNGTLVWDKTIGGSNGDLPSSISVFPDNSLLISGISASNSSVFKSEDVIGNTDIWILKTNQTGEIIWDNTIGGVDRELFGHANILEDGGIFVAASSLSGLSGDKTSPSEGVDDYWLLRLNESGNIIWQESYGGNSEDRQSAKFELNENGSLYLGGFSISGVSGNKTEPNLGSGDYWLVKIDYPLRIEEFNELSFDLVIQENPVFNRLVLFSNMSILNSKYEIYNSLGQIFTSGTLESNRINVEHLKGGVYLLKIEINGKSIIKKFIKD